MKSHFIQIAPYVRIFQLEYLGQDNFLLWSPIPFIIGISSLYPLALPPRPTAPPTPRSDDKKNDSGHYNISPGM